ncbi:uncharacterized protein [Typha latifolia]|uniref:uncharacterized protein n=1 Tax=Typha latifolia TaxID=4733 RepID=UPI003C2D5680
MQSQRQGPQPRPFFLEDYLRSGIATNTSLASARPPISAHAILQAWSNLRNPSSPPSLLLSSLESLTLSRSSLYISDSQANFLLSLLSSSSLPLSSVPSLFSLLSTWLRKSSRPSPSLLQSTLTHLSNILSSSFSFPSHALLLLGALSAANGLPDQSRAACLDLFIRLLDENRDAFGDNENSLPEALGGLGYALSRSDNAYFKRIFGLLLEIWDLGHGPRGTLLHGIMVLRLVEWSVLDFVASRLVGKVEILCGEIAVERSETRRCALFALVMACFGVLRAGRIASSRYRFTLDQKLMRSVEESIGFVARRAILCNGNDRHLLMQCIALGLARSGQISFDASVLMCLCLALLNEIFPLPLLLRMSAENLAGNSVTVVANKVKEHLNSSLFKEAGAVTGALCNQYSFADKDSKAVAESHMLEYSQELYLNLRTAVLVHSGKNDELLGELEKIAEAAFLMVVVFAAEVAKHKLNNKFSQESPLEISVRILVAFSCIEYLRRVRLPEYTDAVRRAVLTIQDNATSCASFVASMPSYHELTKDLGSLTLNGKRYIWSKDEVQTARILFYMRVIPTYVSLIPPSLFGERVASTVFLYMQHPNEKVTRAAHSVLVSFLSSGNDFDQEDRVALKEQLVFYYMRRALEAYPGITPFEGLASGVVAIVRHLPSGSPAIFYCIHSLAEKANEVCRKAMSQETTLWKSWEGSSDPCKKVLDLLLRLISLVDIQVFPYLLKQLAEFLSQLPSDGQSVLLDEMYSQVAESDDVIRKPVLVSWLQSLSYISSQQVSLHNYSIKEGNAEMNVENGVDNFNLNRTAARL